MAPGERLKQGDKLVFYTNSLVFGDNLAVQSRGHDPATPGLAKAAAEPGNRRLQSRINAADAVVSGRVVEVHPHKPAKALVKAAGAPSPPTGRISEHEPFWQEAVIEVSEAHKGPKKNQVVVRFPSSTDVRWYKAPRFKKGQKGVWLFHSDAPAPRATARATGPSPGGAFTCLDGGLSASRRRDEGAGACPAGFCQARCAEEGATDSGQTWSGDLLTVPFGINAGLAVNTSGNVGLLYQQLAGAGVNARWVTHFRSASGGLPTTWSDLVLCDHPAMDPAKVFDPYLGDYAYLTSQGPDFFGIFSASNQPDLAHFPNGVTYQRNHDFAAKKLADLGGNNIAVSIDPFFFKFTP
jgi:hypothetical protein